MKRPQAHSGSRFATLVWVGIFLLFACQVVVFIIGARTPFAGLVDLRAFYAAGTILRTGQGAQLYDYDFQNAVQNAAVSPRPDALPFLYPAFAALPFLPLSLLTYRMAWVVWFVLSLVLLSVAAGLLRRNLPRLRVHPWWQLPVLFGCLFGISVALVQGQISILLLLVYVVAWALLRDDRPLLAGLVASLAMMKFQIALPVALLFLLWARRRFAAGFASGALVLFSLSFAMTGRAGAIMYWRSMTGMTRQTMVDAAAAKAHYGMFPSDMPNLHGLTFVLSHGASWGLVLSGLLSVLVLIFAWKMGPSLAVALPAAMLVSYHMQPHDLTLLLLPLAVLTDAWQAGSLRRWERYTLLVSVAFLVLPLAGVLMVWSAHYLASLAVAGVLLVAGTSNAERRVSGA